jgi:two-component system, cell cycle response regulator
MDVGDRSHASGGRSSHLRTPGRVNTSDTKPIVLLIDDSVDVHRLLQVRLRHEQLRLVGTTNGREAIELAQQVRPSAILLDLDMPDMDGFELLRAIKDDPTTHAVPVIILSNVQGSEEKVTAFDLGATDFVTKPFDLAELRARLRAALRLDHLLRLLAERADVDGLTGLGNRAHFDKRWGEKVAECRRYGHALSLAMIDVDFFKRINDTFGHPAGDEVLQRVAQLLLRECRQPDVLCRYGGEEFALVMPSTDTPSAEIVTERIRRALESTVWHRHPDQPITVSIGLVGIAGTCGSVSPEQWLEATDRNLYVAKRGGRNRVVSSTLTTVPSGLYKAG